MLSDFQNSVTERLDSKFVITLSLNIDPHTLSVSYTTSPAVLKISDIYFLHSCSIPNFISVLSPVIIHFVVDVLFSFILCIMHCLIVPFDLMATKLNKLYYCYYYYLWNNWHLVTRSTQCRGFLGHPVQAGHVLQLIKHLTRRKGDRFTRAQPALYDRVTI